MPTQCECGTGYYFSSPLASTNSAFRTSSRNPSLGICFRVASNGSAWFVDERKGEAAEAGGTREGHELPVKALCKLSLNASIFTS